MGKSPPAPKKPKFTNNHVEAVKSIDQKAGFRIASMHLVPSDAAPDNSGQCYSVPLPNGGHFLHCDP
jgi:hypothetical protein